MKHIPVIVGWAICAYNMISLLLIGYGFITPLYLAPIVIFHAGAGILSLIYTVGR